MYVLHVCTFDCKRQQKTWILKSCAWYTQLCGYTPLSAKKIIYMHPELFVDRTCHTTTTNAVADATTSWHPRVWLSTRLCDYLGALMVGSINVKYPHSVVFYIIDAIKLLGVTQDIMETMINLPWTKSSPLIRRKVASCTTTCVMALPRQTNLMRESNVFFIGIPKTKS